MRNHKLEVTNTSSITSEMRRMGDLHAASTRLKHCSITISGLHTMGSLNTLGVSECGSVLGVLTTGTVTGIHYHSQRLTTLLQPVA